MSVDDALAKVDAWLSTEMVTVIAEKPDHWRVLRNLLASTGTAGNLTTDAHLAALAITHDATLASCDNDFSRFADLRWENPLQSDQRWQHPLSRDPTAMFLTRAKRSSQEATGDSLYCDLRPILD